MAFSKEEYSVDKLADDLADIIAENVPAHVLKTCQRTQVFWALKCGENKILPCEKDFEIYEKPLTAILIFLNGRVPNITVWNKVMEKLDRCSDYTLSGRIKENEKEKEKQELYFQHKE